MNNETLEDIVKGQNKKVKNLEIAIDEEDEVAELYDQFSNLDDMDEGYKS